MCNVSYSFVAGNCVKTSNQLTILSSSKYGGHYLSINKFAIVEDYDC
jgi:hypothetical protein